MPGPYFLGQQPASCGCYYPDVTRIRDDKPSLRRVLLCINHGEFWDQLHCRTSLCKSEWPIPTEEWRKAERARLQGKSTAMPKRIRRIAA